MEHADPVKLFTAIGLMLSIVLAGSAVSYFWEDIKRLASPFFMSNSDRFERLKNAGTGTGTLDTVAVVPVSKPVPSTSTEPVLEMMEPAEPRDIISRHMEKQDLVVLLAAQKDEKNSYRYSANAIAQLIGGNRGEVLEVIREVREPTPPFKPKAVYRELDEDGKPILTHTA